jgi:hypothetical protein
MTATFATDQGGVPEVSPIQCNFSRAGNGLGNRAVVSALEGELGYSYRFA